MSDMLSGLICTFSDCKGVFNVYYGQEKTVLRLGQLGIDLGERDLPETWVGYTVYIYI